MARKALLYKKETKFLTLKQLQPNVSQHYSLDTAGEIGSILSGNVIEVIGTKMDDARWENIKKEVNILVQKKEQCNVFES